jgi:hypothetical protein
MYGLKTAMKESAALQRTESETKDLIPFLPSVKKTPQNTKVSNYLYIFPSY